MKNNQSFGLFAGIGAVLIAILAVGGYLMTKEDKAAEPIVAVAEETQAPQDGEEQAQQTPDAIESAAGTPDVAQPVDVDGFKVEPGNPVVATVDGKDITRVDVYRFIQTMPENIQQLPATQVYPIALEQVINTRLIQNKAEEKKIQESEAFKREMDIVKQQIARNLYLQQQVDAQITEEKMRKRYDEVVKSIPEVEERRARHILVESENKAKAVVERLKKGDSDFAELAAELSTDSTKGNGGDLGYFAKNDMVPEFANAVFQMEKGAVLETPVKTQFGYHIIKVEDIRKRPNPPFEQVVPQIQAEMRREILEDMLQKWRKDAKITQFDINGKPLKPGANAIGVVPEKQEEAPAKQEG